MFSSPVPSYAWSELVLFVVCSTALYSSTRLPGLPDRIAWQTSLGLLAVTALTAVIRYLFDLVDLLEGPHSMFSTFYGTVGMPLLAFGLSGILLRADRNKLRLVTLIAVLLLVTARVSDTIAVIRLVIGVICSLVLLAQAWFYYRRSYRRPAVYLASATLLLVVNGLFVKASGDLLFGLIDRWHVFHILLAVVIFLFHKTDQFMGKAGRR